MLADIAKVQGNMNLFKSKVESLKAAEQVVMCSTNILNFKGPSTIVWTKTGDDPIIRETTSNWPWYSSTNNMQCWWVMSIDTTRLDSELELAVQRASNNQKSLEVKMDCYLSMLSASSEILTAKRRSFRKKSLSLRDNSQCKVQKLRRWNRRWFTA